MRRHQIFVALSSFRQIPARCAEGLWQCLGKNIEVFGPPGAYTNAAILGRNEGHAQEHAARAYFRQNRTGKCPVPTAIERHEVCCGRHWHKAIRPPNLALRITRSAKRRLMPGKWRMPKAAHLALKPVTVK